MKLPVNLFTSLPEDHSREHVDLLAKNAGTRIERTVSRGQSSPEGEGWYDQDQDEWVIVLKGAAILTFEDDPDDGIQLEEGDHLTIPAHTRHRVKWTDPDTETIWLAVHL